MTDLILPEEAVASFSLDEIKNAQLLLQMKCFKRISGFKQEFPVTSSTFKTLLE